jgi:hypothetical protein
MPERTTIRLPQELLARAKRKAAAEGRTLTALIEDSLRSALAERSRLGKRTPLPPPVSRATGGPMPGIDITSSLALQEIEDLEALERMKRFK